MSNPDLSKMIVLGSFESGPNRVITIPPPVVAQAAARFDAQHARIEREASRAKLRVMQDARNRSKLKKALNAVFRRGRRGR